MKLYNTLGRHSQVFKPLKPGEVSLYSCGPTVYDYAQLGNLRSFVFDDTLRRVLEFAGFNVKQVMNITDVGHLASDMDEGEDKLETSANREGKSVWQVAEHFTKAFAADARALNILPPNGYRGKNGPYARATDFIDQQIEIIRILIEKNYAYQTKEAIYFDVTKLADYGELSGQKLADKEVGARREVVTDPNKHNPQDFALWFFLVGRFKNHSMLWSSPWGDGFPGWHLECSAIIHRILGDPIDIHTGGVDHIGTHHTNEIAQTEAAFGNKLANYWLHNEFLLIDGQKMSKSLGNFFTLKDVVDKGYNPLALRLLFLQAHYRSQQNFTWDSLQAAQNALTELYAWADTSKQAQPTIDQTKLLTALKSPLVDDLNTAEALAVISHYSNQVPSEDLLRKLDDIFGLSLSGRPDITLEQNQLINRREAARQDQDWQLADRLRTKLQSEGLEINDTPSGQLWRRIN